MAKEGLERLATLAGLKRLDGLERFENPLDKEAPDLPELPSLSEAVEEDDRSDLEQRIAREVGSNRLARKLMELLDRFPQATVPELIALEFLDRRGIDYEYQVPIFGGRQQKGGQILDMVVKFGVGRAYAWRIQGQVIHSLRGRPQLDAIQESALIGAQIGGTTIHDVLDIYDSRLEDEDRRQRVLEAALAGIELGP